MQIIYGKKFEELKEKINILLITAADCERDEVNNELTPLQEEKDILEYRNDEYEYFLDYQLDYEYGASGDFENVRLLTDTEFEKYSRMFAKYFNEIGRDELRLVHYSYYNGCDEPSIYELEEI